MVKKKPKTTTAQRFRQQLAQKKQTSEMPQQIMRQLAERDQMSELRNLTRNSFLAKQKATQLQNQLSVLEDFWAYPGPRDAKQRNRMIDQVKADLGAQMKQVIPVAPLPIYR